MAEDAGEESVDRTTRLMEELLRLRREHVARRQAGPLAPGGGEGAAGGRPATERQLAFIDDLARRGEIGPEEVSSLGSHPTVAQANALLNAHRKAAGYLDLGNGAGARTGGRDAARAAIRYDVGDPEDAAWVSGQMRERGVDCVVGEGSSEVRYMDADGRATDALREMVGDLRNELDAADGTHDGAVEGEGDARGRDREGVAPGDAGERDYTFEEVADECERESARVAASEQTLGRAAAPQRAGRSR